VRWLLNCLYLLALVMLSPWLVWRSLRTGRYRQGLAAKLFGVRERLPAGAVWFHGVSVGEVHLLRQVIAAFRRRRPEVPCVVSASTDTGLAEARRCFADLAVFPFPFDFSWAVRRTLRSLRPALIVLAESEIWPNFLLGCRSFGVPVAIINGRMSPRSRRRWGRVTWLARWLFGKFDLFAVQTEEYAAAIRGLGVAMGRVHVTGSVKYDGVNTDPGNPRTSELRRLLHIQPEQLVWIAGSTQTPEEEMVVAIYQRVSQEFPMLRLILVPRQKDSFDGVAALLERSGLSFARRSSEANLDRPVILVDTIGELGALWGLADVAFVGGSLDGKRGGQNMIEPAAYGAAVVFGPHVWNFADTARRLYEVGGAVQVEDAAELEGEVQRLLHQPGERAAMGAAAREFVLQQQGATERTISLLDELLRCRDTGRRAA
jgi:3-deoxy-D-manno-octulosonic-acid transferase